MVAAVAACTRALTWCLLWLRPRCLHKGPLTWCLLWLLAQVATDMVPAVAACTRALTCVAACTRSLSCVPAVAACGRFQVLEHMGCVWDVRFLVNGDLATACANSVAYLWTSSAERAVRLEGGLGTGQGQRNSLACLSTLSVGRGGVSEADNG